MLYINGNQLLRKAYEKKADPKRPIRLVDVDSKNVDDNTSLFILLEHNSSTLSYPLGCSSYGRVLASHARGMGFNSPHLHFLSFAFYALATLVPPSSGLYFTLSLPWSHLAVDSIGLVGPIPRDRSITCSYENDRKIAKLVLFSYLFSGTKNKKEKPTIEIHDQNC
jgi:hypothetical protein